MRSKIVSAFALLLFTSACSGSSSAPSAAQAVVETNPITAITPTPSPGTDPNASPTPVVSPTATPVPTPTPVVNDWNRATNLSEAVSNITIDAGLFNHKILVTYYDLDHLTANPNDFTHTVKFSATFFHPGLKQFTIALKNNDSKFDGSTLVCDKNCTSGVLNLVYNGGTTSKLTGTAAATFFRKDIVGNPAISILGTPATSDIEKEIVHSLKRGNQLVSGQITAFQVQNGFVQPFDVTLEYSSDGYYPVQGQVEFLGTKSGAGVFAYYSNDYTNINDSGSLGNVNVVSDGSTNLGFCFTGTTALRSIAASTVKGAAAFDPCQGQ